MNKKILIYIEINKNRVEKVSKEITQYLKSKFPHFETVGLVIGDFKTVDNIKSDLQNIGLDRVYYVVDPVLDNYNTVIYSKIATDVINNIKPDSVLIGATTNGRELAPRIASRLSIGLTADCTNIDFDENGLLATRPTYGGKMMATILSKTLPHFATVRPGTLKAESSKINTILEEYNYEINIEPVQLLHEIISKEEKPEKEDWTCSEIIISGGLGLKNKENFEKLYRLADLLGAKVAASRAAVEQGWADASIQVGQTGSSVSPKLYIAFGISGAMQHLVGIDNADKIIAINSDKTAPIMKSADYSIVADAEAVLSEMINNLEG